MVKRIQECHDCLNRFITSQKGSRLCNDCAEEKPLSSLTTTKRTLSLLESNCNIGSPPQATDFIKGDITVCSVCGNSLSHLQKWESRIQHVKRCSKKFGVQAQDLCSNDDEELFEDSAVETNQNDGIEKAAPPQKNSIHSILMNGAKHAARVEKIQKDLRQQRPQKRGRGSMWDQSSRNYCPSYKRIPGTDFVVDGFQYVKQANTTNFFLTHFHADHYGGLTKAFDAGTIFCSKVTASLVEQQLGVNPRFLRPLPINQRVNLSPNKSVILLDANHCPGAVMFLFEIGKKIVLHVGDFRWHHNQMVRDLKPFLSRPIDELFLDTTYCDAKKILPTQAEAIQATVDLVSREYTKALKNGYRILLLFGAYTIGKERIYISVAKALGVKIHVDRRRYRILSVLGYDKETMDLFTTNADETDLWVVPLSNINMKNLPGYLKLESRSFSRILGIRPTGWAMKSKSSSLLNVSLKGSIMVCGVPYSEHSSFPELVDCIETLQPRRIVPTVSVSKSDAQVKLLMAHLKVKI